ncbi:MAG: MerR family transcriptional regulator [Nocardioidaceae bacterium]|nr:MerR family transcriptional regulator [Nocardioidaceae bacterium]
MRISELAERVGVPTSTVRYYERVGLLAAPARTPSGYRAYDDAAAARLLFVTRARHMGLTCEQITTLLPVWEGSNCGAARLGVTRLVEEKQAEIALRIAELEAFARELDRVRSTLEDEPVPDHCRADLSCCVPEAAGPVTVELSAVGLSAVGLSVVGLSAPRGTPRAGAPAGRTC